MRQVKFKVWNEVLKQWVDSKTCFLSAEGAIHFKMNDWLSFAAPHYKAVFSTGIYDKNGDEIYEGDIVQYGTENYEVIYKYNRFCLKDHNPKYSFAPFYYEPGVQPLVEVLGNRFENPELLS